MTATILPSSWRGLGGQPPNVNTVEFDKQLDKLSLWIEAWDHDQRCDVLEGLMRRSNYSQLQFLWTVLQPSLHRDFMYSSKKEFPQLEFTPVSTYKSRELKDKLVLHRQDDFYRIKSAHMRYFDEVRQASREQKLRNEHALDIMNREKPKTRSPTHHSPERQISPRLAKVHSSLTLPNISSNRMMSQSQSNVCTGLRTGEDLRSSWDVIKSAPPSLRFIEMPVRRHMQEEISPQRKKSVDLQTMVGVKTTDTQKVLRGKKEKRRREKGMRAHFATSDPLNQTLTQLPEEAKEMFHWYADLWSDVQRNEFLHKLLLKLDPRQHYFISSFLSIKQYRDFISLLPEPLALKILRYLTPTELLNVTRVCRTWERLANHNDLWKSKCKEVTLEIPISNNPVWKKVFKDNMFLKMNWATGKCRIIEMRGHSQRVLSVTFDRKRIATGSGDKTIKIWNINNGNLQQTLKGHTKGVWCLSFFTKNLLVSASYDGTIKVWNLKQGSTVRTLFGHEGPIWCMVRRDSVLVTGSQDRTAKVWDIGRCLLLKTLTGHQAAVFAVDMDEDGKIAVTGSADRSVRIWDIWSGLVKKVIWVKVCHLNVEKITTSIMSVSYSKGYIACSFGETICLYKLEGAKLIKTYEEHQKRIENLQLRITDPATAEGVMVTAGKDGCVKYWDISLDRSVQSFKHSDHEINCIHFDELRIASASADHVIKVWNFNVD